MIITNKNLKAGKITVQAQSLDDLWYLSHIVQLNDIVTGTATRKVRMGSAEEAVKKTYTLSITVESVEFKRFEPREFIAERDKVVVLGSYEGVAKKTGRAFKSDWVMVYTIADGKVAHFREYADVVAITAAF